MGYKNFKQKDTKWNKNYYSGGTISAQGCGPTSIADAVYDLVPSITPAKTAKWMEDNVVLVTAQVHIIQVWSRH